MPWYVLYTKSRNEKLVAEKLRQRGIEVYCPLHKTRRKWSDRYKIIEEPLFRSYCFVQLADHERNNVFNVSGVVRYLFWQQKPAIVRDAEIEAIKRLLNDFDHACITVDQLKPGDRLTIASGSFTDLSGQVITQQGKTVRIVLDSLQLVVKLDLSQVLVAT
ncbi:MAG: UpxY family transcription antiterminator [Cytophagales bacterium]|nr:MAG: UpxY family transcription antiterminator [Cytophagales bacterium]